MVRPTCRAECTPWPCLDGPERREPGLRRGSAGRVQCRRGRRRAGIRAATCHRRGEHPDFASGAWLGSRHAPHVRRPARSERAAKLTKERRDRPMLAGLEVIRQKEQGNPSGGAKYGVFAGTKERSRPAVLQKAADRPRADGGPSALPLGYAANRTVCQKE